MKIAERFRHSATVCWMTTYTFDPAFFEAFLLRRLGEPPLNVVVLADFGRLGHQWQQIGDEERRWIRRANREYLLRGVSPSGGAFHAKTIMLGNQRGGQLLIGSGNIGLSGIENGREVYSAFDSTLESDGGSFAEWREWMGDLVRGEDDADLRIRWSDLLGRLPWLSEARGSGPLRTNRERPIIDNLLDGVEPPVDELHVTAPFYDAGLRALTALVDRSGPRRLRVYLGSHASVDGSALAALLGHHSDAQALRWSPATYVHAKIAAVVQGDSARVTAGSANLSQVALLASATTPGSNVEANVVVELSAADARSLFAVPGLSLEAVGLGELSALSIAPMEPAVSFAHRLQSATREPDGRVRLRVDPGLLPDGALLTDGVRREALVAGEVKAWAPTEDVVLVWLEEEAGGVLSNRVALEDRVALDRMLSTRTQEREHPSGIEERDLGHPLGELLADLHRHAMFDIDDTPAGRRIADLEAATDQAGAEFWDRYLQNELQLDPRHAHYAKFSRTLAAPLESELSWLLSQMLARVPMHQQIHLLSGEPRTAAEREGQSWTPDQRLQVRAYNVLQRWSQALADPRSRWIEDLAPTVHYGALLGAIREIWAQQTWLPPHRLPGLAFTLFSAFIRSERSPGYLFSIDETEREAGIDAIRAEEWGAQAAAIAYCALRDAKPADYFAWQAFLVPGLAWGLFAATEATDAVVEALHGAKPNHGAVDERLAWVASYTDDEHWAARVADELDLGGVALSPIAHPTYRYELAVGGQLDLLHDPRVVTLAREALDYTKSPGVRLRTLAGIATFAYGDAVYARLADGRSVESATALSRDELLTREASGQSLDAFVAGSAEVA
ncbi:MAG: hypothetical protein H0V12_06710 [Chloroflexi bacterium]|nr:hypothetical protein [Chloroflexota bacterium]